MPVIEGLELGLRCPEVADSAAADFGASERSLVTLCVRFRVELAQAARNPGPLLGRVEIRGHAGGRSRRLFNLIPGFLVDFVDAAEQRFEFRGDVLGVALTPYPRARVATLRLSGPSMPDPARPVWFSLGHQGLEDISCEGLQAVVCLRAIGCGSRWSRVSEPTMVPKVPATARASCRDCAPELRC